MAVSNPPYSPLGERLRERTQPLAPDDQLYNYAHAKLCEGMMLPFAQLAELVDPPDPYIPWEPLLNVDLCPYWALPWLGQVVGVRVPKTLSEADMRMMIKSLGSFARGSPGAIEAAAGFGLTGTKTVLFRERDAGDAYRLEIVVLERECADIALVRSLVLSQKPGGIVVDVHTIVGWDYQQMKTAFVGKVYSDVKTTYPTYDDLKTGPY